MAVEFFVSVRIGQDEFVKQFGSEHEAMECFDSLSVATDEVGIEGNSYTRDSNAKLESVTVHRRMNQGVLGDPRRQ